MGLQKSQDRLLRLFVRLNGCHLVIYDLKLKTFVMKYCQEKQMEQHMCIIAVQ